MPTDGGSSTPPARSGMTSLYANLLDPSTSKNGTPASASTTISRAPVVFDQASTPNPPNGDANAKRQQLNSAALRFQPTKRPQPSAQKPKPKPNVRKPPVSALNATSTPESAKAVAPSSDNVHLKPSVKSTLADWTATGEDDDVNGFYDGGEKRQRGGRKRRKKNNQERQAVSQNWDDIYDPSRPNSYEEYKHSDEKIREVREWKDRLYAHRMARVHSSDEESQDDRDTARRANNAFAPPSKYSFAPPAFESSKPATSPPPPPPADIPDDPSGDDAYARRVRLSAQQHSGPPSAHLSAPVQPHQPPTAVTPSFGQDSISSVGKDQTASSSISRAPVRYNFPAAPSDIPASEAELEKVMEQEEPADPEVSEQDVENEQRSLRPGQKGFAERLMSKYGWTKGSGLGASRSGIVNPLRVQVEKQKKKPDSEGGGFVGPGGRGKIIGGKKKAGADSTEDTTEGRFGSMSEVIALHGMVDGMDLDAELEGAGDGGLMQEIGEECGEKYGRVERVFIHRGGSGAPKVFVKFTSQLSALRAVNALEGRIFNGNAIAARFFDTDRFEMGQYD
ncbi:MAG: hypothetical protein M1817_004048 [Caeruleum heppii]|nr:MAG: hypothetical protein M1817_004048 [Caeruleum heppii]